MRRGAGDRPPFAFWVGVAGWVAVGQPPIIDMLRAGCTKSAWLMR
jgi:hypothetical protein